MLPGELAADGDHDGAEFGGEQDLEVGPECEEFADGGVVGVESEGSFDPVGSIGRRGWVRAGSPSFGLAVDERELQRCRCETDTDSAQLASSSGKAGRDGLNASLERVEELEAAVRAAGGVHGNAGAGERLEVAEHGAGGDLKVFGEIDGGVASAVLEDQHEPQ